MNDMVGKITAALDEAEARWKRSSLDPWAVDLDGHPGNEFSDPYLAVTVGAADSWVCSFPSDDSEISQADAALIVSVVNREARQIQHARHLLRVADQIEAVLPANAAGIRDDLAAVWCPEDAS